MSDRQVNMNFAIMVHPFWKCKFHIIPPVCVLVGWMFGWLVVQLSSQSFGRAGSYTSMPYISRYPSCTFFNKSEDMLSRLLIFLILNICICFCTLSFVFRLVMCLSFSKYKNYSKIKIVSKDLLSQKVTRVPFQAPNIFQRYKVIRYSVSSKFRLELKEPSAKWYIYFLDSGRERREGGE